MRLPSGARGFESLQLREEPGSQNGEPGSFYLSYDLFLFCLCILFRTLRPA